MSVQKSLLGAEMLRIHASRDMTPDQLRMVTLMYKTPGITQPELARECQCDERTIRRWKSEYYEKLGQLVEERYRSEVNLQQWVQTDQRRKVIMTIMTRLLFRYGSAGGCPDERLDEVTRLLGRMGDDFDNTVDQQLIDLEERLALEMETISAYDYMTGERRKWIRKQN